MGNCADSSKCYPTPSSEYVSPADLLTFEIDELQRKLNLSLETYNQLQLMSQALNHLLANEDSKQQNINKISFLKGHLQSNMLFPVFYEPNTKLHLIGIPALECILKSRNFFAFLVNLLMNYYPYPVIQPVMWNRMVYGSLDRNSLVQKTESAYIPQHILRDQCEKSTNISEGLQSTSVLASVIDGSTPLTNSSTSSSAIPPHPTPPVLVSYVCRLVINFAHLLPRLIPKLLSRHQITTILMNIIDFDLLESLNCDTNRTLELNNLGSHLIAAYSDCLRLLRCLASLDLQFKHLLLSDIRFITRIVYNLNAPTTSSICLQSLWYEEIMLLTLLLTPSPDNPVDLIRPAFYPLASRVENWGNLIYHILRKIERTTLTDDSDQQIFTTFYGSKDEYFVLGRTALFFLAVVLSVQPMEHKNTATGKLNRGRRRTKNIKFSCDDSAVRHGLAHLENPVRAELERSLVFIPADSSDDDNLSVFLSGQIAGLLGRLINSFPQPQITRSGDLVLETSYENSAIDGSVVVFGRSFANRQAVQTALKVLLAVSPLAKAALISDGYIDNICLRSHTVLNKLNVCIQRRTVDTTINSKSKVIPTGRPCADLGVQAWHTLTSQLIRLMELLSNLLYTSPDAKQMAINAKLPHLLHAVWPIALYDSHVLHTLLACSLNFTADSPSVASALATGGHFSSSLEPRSQTMSVEVERRKPHSHAAYNDETLGANTIVKSLCRYLSSSLLRFKNLTPQIKTEDCLIHSEKCLPASKSRVCNSTQHLRDMTIRQTFNILANLVWSSEALNAIAKAKTLLLFTNLDPRKISKSFHGSQIQLLWLRILVNMSFTHEGQNLLISTPGVLSVLSEQLQHCRGLSYQMVLLCLHNICTHKSAKNFLTNTDFGILQHFAKLLEPSHRRSLSEYALVISAIMSTAYHSQKFQLMLKCNGFCTPLNNLKTFCQQNKYLTPLLDDVDLILQALTS